MGIGPVPAANQALAAAGLTLDQMDICEVNEAFAPQFLSVQKNSVWITIKLICVVVPSLWVIHLVHPVPELPDTWSMPSIVLVANMLLDLPVLVAVKALLSSCKYFFKNTYGA